MKFLMCGSTSSKYHSVKQLRHTQRVQVFFLNAVDESLEVRGSNGLKTRGIDEAACCQRGAVQGGARARGG